jgi:hypothetical protein
MCLRMILVFSLFLVCLNGYSSDSIPSATDVVSVTEHTKVCQQYEIKLRLFQEMSEAGNHKISAIKLYLALVKVSVENGEVLKFVEELERLIGE